MLKIISRSDHHHGEVSDSVVLPYALRQKGRFKTTTISGVDVGVFLIRGEVLRDGDILFSECGKVLKVKAEPESVVTAIASDWLTFAKACYHLGNRHVPMQIGERWVRFQPDHVLEEMVEIFGLKCKHHQASFTPESGAYHGGGHSHGDSGHSHDEKEHAH
jgi:urease accessory protein